MDVVELRDKNLERAKKWAVSIKSTLKAGYVPPYSGSREEQEPWCSKGKGQEENRGNNGNATVSIAAKAKKTVMFGSTNR